MIAGKTDTTADKPAVQIIKQPQHKPRLRPSEQIKRGLLADGAMPDGTPVFYSGYAKGFVTPVSPGGGSYNAHGEDDTGWRKMSESRNDIDDARRRAGWTHAIRMVTEQAIPKAVVDRLVDGILGANGVSFLATATDEDARKIIQRIMDDHWHDPENDWNNKLPPRVADSLVMGELAWPLFLNPLNGKITVRAMDVQIIKDVHADKLSCETVNTITIDGEYTCQVLDPDKPGEDAVKPETKKILAVLRRAPVTGEIKGDVLFQRFNHLASQLRGVSIFFPIVDWLQAYDDASFSMAERANLQYNVFTTYTLDTTDEEEIEKFKNEYGAAQPGSVAFLNDKIKRDVQVPNFNAGDYQQMLSILLRPIISCIGIPDFWLGEGGNANLATATAMNEPAFRRIEAKQNNLRSLLTLLMDYVIQERLKAQPVLAKLVPKNQRTFDVVMDPINTKAIFQEAAALGQITTSLTLAVDSKLLSLEDAQSIYAQQILQVTGITVVAPEPDDEAETPTTSGALEPPEIVEAVQVDPEAVRDQLKVGEPVGG